MKQWRLYWTVTGATGRGTEFMLDFDTEAEAQEAADDYRGYGQVSGVRVECIG